MTKREHVIKTVQHQDSGKVPYCIQITKEAVDLYGEKLLEDFFNRDVRDDLKEGKLILREAINLSIGNYMMTCPHHWWKWDFDNTDPSYKD